NLVLQPDTYVKVFVIGHCWFAAAGIYAFLRAAGARPVASLVGGVVYCFSGPYMSTLNLGGHHNASAAWAGWVLFALVRALKGPGLRAAAALGACAAMLTLAGSPEVVAM